MKYQHILIATDFSKQKDMICAKARELAEQHQANLSICHIIEDFPLTDFAYEPMISVDIDMRDALLESGKKQLATLAESLSIPLNQQWVELGTSGHDIVRVADENNVDLIIVGSHGRHGFKRLLGSTANAVLHHAHCDVLAVRLKDD
ncbi:MAG TPA: universal stress protein [Methylophaga aminisulfidivorans]|uniref:universal stress protein n=1 Tax=Methylophaga TaxID=40222 RepID=UPI0017775C57|nr:MULTISPECIES: universal stress protein [Methylophaga]HIC45226.1 universal stress protein [Methylophaga sp.]HIM38525.1 universal stress protein [Methylophaga aminisulfidivorans]